MNYEKPILIDLALYLTMGACVAGPTNIEGECTAGGTARAACTAGVSDGAACSAGTIAANACTQGVTATDACTAGTAHGQ